MTTLAELLGPNPTRPGPTVGYYQSVQQWSLGGNQKFGDCTFVSLCNLLDLVSAVNGTPFVIGAGEAENFYSREAGFNSQNPATDKGAVLADVIAYWADQGWPSDPVNKPLGWCAIEPGQIHQAVHSLGAVPAWCMLPDGGDGWDFTDAPIRAGTPGTGAHAVLIVGSDVAADTLTLVSWAALQTVSRQWWDTYGRGAFAVLAPGWRVR